MEEERQQQQEEMRMLVLRLLHHRWQGLHLRLRLRWHLPGLHRLLHLQAEQ